MPENKDIVIANLPATEPEEPPFRNPPVAAPREPSEPALPTSVPGQNTPARTDFSSSGLSDDDGMDFFIKDIQRPAAGEETEEVAEATPPETPAAPAPEPAATPAAKPAIDPALIALAGNFGVPPEEAALYGPENLVRVLNRLAAQTRASGRQTQGESVPPAAPPEPELEFPDIAKLEEEGFDPVLVNMAKSMKAMHDRYKVKLSEVDKVQKSLLEDSHRRQAEARQRAVVESFKEAGFEASSFEPSVLNKIVARVRSLYQVYQQEGVQPPTAELIRTAVGLVAPSVKPINGATTEAAAKRRTLDAVEKARAMDRNGRVRGAPSHRGGPIRDGGQLRQTLIDKGYDPKEPAPDGNGDSQVFLPG